MSKKLFTIAIAALAAGSLLLAACTTADPGQSTSTAQERTLLVSGTGKVELAPDIAYVNIGVHSENKGAAAAVNDNNSAAQKIIAAMKSAGVDAKDIRTINFSIYPRQETDNQGHVTGITYMVDNNVQVTVRDVGKIGALLDQAVAAGANSINGIQFDVADRTAAEQKARELAIQDAQSQAQALAKAAGVSLGPVQTINAQVIATPPPPIYAQGAAAAAPGLEVPISSGQLTVQVNVSVTYTIQ